MERKAEYTLTHEEIFKNHEEIRSKVLSITNRNVAVTDEVMARMRFLDERTRSNVNVTMFTAMVAVLLSDSWSMKGIEKKIGHVKETYLYRDPAVTKSSYEPTNEDVLLDMYRYAMMILATKDKNKMGF